MQHTARLERADGSDSRVSAFERCGAQNTQSALEPEARNARAARFAPHDGRAACSWLHPGSNRCVPGAQEQVVRLAHRAHPPSRARLIGGRGPAAELLCEMGCCCSASNNAEERAPLVASQHGGGYNPPGATPAAEEDGGRGAEDRRRWGEQKANLARRRRFQEKEALDNSESWKVTCFCRIVSCHPPAV